MERAERCETCRFWEHEGEVQPELEIRETLAPQDDENPASCSSRDVLEHELFIETVVDMLRNGHCRRLPPQVVVWPPQEPDDATCDSRWPRTKPEDWCGEWQGRPT